MLSCVSSSLQATNSICFLTRSSQPTWTRTAYSHWLRSAQSQRFSCGKGVCCVSGSGSTPGKPSSHSLPPPVTALEAASDDMTALVSRPAFLFAAAVGLSIIAFDVNNSASPHFLPQFVDQPAHAWVKANLPVPIKNLVAEKLVSDLFITGGVGGWVLAGAAGISRSGWVGVRRLAIALLMYVYGGGSIQHGKFLFSAGLFSCTQT